MKNSNDNGPVLTSKEPFEINRYVKRVSTGQTGRIIEMEGGLDGWVKRCRIDWNQLPDGTVITGVGKMPRTWIRRADLMVIA